MDNRTGSLILVAAIAVQGCGRDDSDEMGIREHNAEHIVPTEQVYTPPIIRSSKEETDKVQHEVRDGATEYVRDNRPAPIFRRDAHAKAHGCVRATVTVEENLPKKVAGVGVFQPGKEYQAWIRFSSGNGRLQSDTEKDARGMAVKLMNVPGDKMLESKYGSQDMTQDFLMINFPQFFLDTLEEYQVFARAQTDDKQFDYFIPNKLNPFTIRWKQLWIGLGVLGERPLDRLTLNPLYEHYHSMTPYALGVEPVGPEPRKPVNAVKHSAEAVSCADLESSPKVVGRQAQSADNFLRDNLNLHLQQADACFRFNLHLQDPLADMPIEEPTVAWEDAEVVHAATIVVPKQQFDSVQHNEFCEQMAFSPWHGLPAHRPLGAINRVRKAVYEEISLYRHMRNSCPDNSPGCLGYGDSRRRIHQPTGWCIHKNMYGELVADGSCQP